VLRQTDWLLAGAGSGGTCRYGKGSAVAHFSGFLQGLAFGHQVLSSLLILSAHALTFCILDMVGHPSVAN
jgi:hypothetical protein